MTIERGRPFEKMGYPVSSLKWSGPVVLNEWPGKTLRPLALKINATVFSCRFRHVL
jgi:hypothetical protein